MFETINLEENCRIAERKCPTGKWRWKAILRGGLAGLGLNAVAPVVG